MSPLHTWYNKFVPFLQFFNLKKYNNRLIFFFLLTLIFLVSTSLYITTAINSERIKLSSKATEANTNILGYLDLFEDGLAAGWVRDDDTSKSVDVEIYIDNVLITTVPASQDRQDLPGKNAFHWKFPQLGYGAHTLAAYAVDLDSVGNKTGKKVELVGSPKNIQSECKNLTNKDEYAWCVGNPNYWIKRQSDTIFLQNDTVRVGINKSYGGMITQLYNPKSEQNLIEEHGGSAVQLSWYGFDNSNLYKNYKECNEFEGRYDAPWNPIQAQGPECTWDSPENDVDFFRLLNDTKAQTFYYDPSNFSKTAPPISGLAFKQTISVEDSYVKVTYKIDYTGSLTFDTKDFIQELPAIFTGSKMSRFFYWEGGDRQNYDRTTYDINKEYNVQEVTTSGRPLLLFTKEGLIEHDKIIDPYDRPAFPWWGVCDNDKKNCVTIYAEDTDIIKGAFIMNLAQAALSTPTPIDIERFDGAYITAFGQFPEIKPGFSKTFTLYIFPYRYSERVNGKTILQRIHEMHDKN